MSHWSFNLIKGLLLMKTFLSLSSVSIFLFSSTETTLPYRINYFGDNNDGLNNNDDGLNDCQHHGQPPQPSQ